MDECYLDYTSIVNVFLLRKKAAYIRNYIYSHFGFTVNVGISSNKVLAKMASDFESRTRRTHFSLMKIQKMWLLPISIVCSWQDMLP